VIGFAIDYYQARLWADLGGEAGADASVGRELDLADGRDSANNSEGRIEALEACLAALEHVDRNANLALVVQNWCEELAAGAVAKT
jgi:hypothetical protein